jgi:hypothetical protein
MPPSVTRRRFVVSAGIAGAGVTTFQFSPPMTAQRGADPPNPVFEHLGREFARIHKVAKAGPPRAEHLHSLAANFRLLAVVFPNDLIKTAARRSDLNLHDHQRHARQAEEVRRRFGMNITGEGLPPVDASAEARDRARFEREGLTPTLLTIAARLDAAAARVASRGDVPTPYRQVQYCAYLEPMRIAMELTCAFAPFLGPQGLAACATATAAYWAAQATMAWMYGC